MRNVVLMGVLLAGLAACSDVNFGEFSSTGDSAASVKDSSNVDYHPNDQHIVSGRMQFKEGNYGKAYRHFKKAIDVAPQDPQAWLGYAASADMLRRFDKADFAYRKLQPVIGNRIEFLNNYGYSHLLRGNLTTARKYFLKAYEIDPSNEFAANNLELLRNSVAYQRRAPGDLKGI
ncbi:Tetratricopeptide repeat-containing protein [Aliiroseovarius crassostreae]|nr:tetratricopeptide repeat protein [Aliiroseovarius crassostreae]SFU90879.1 Tetratricopeptide repeat-containing protein [Aliiroseovarius crassostreae]